MTNDNFKVDARITILKIGEKTTVLIIWKITEGESSMVGSRSGQSDPESTTLILRPSDQKIESDRKEEYWRIVY